MRELSLTEEDEERFSWQIMIPGFGADAQRKLKGASALVTRVGGLGGPAAMNLALAGIGKLVIAHGGVVELSNMNRMVLMSCDAIGQPRAGTAARQLRSLNPTVEVVAIDEDVTPENVGGLVSQVDVVLDCAPLFEERHLLNDACVRQGKPMVESAVCDTKGYLTTIMPGKTPCLSCLGFRNPEWRLPFPVLGAVPCALGSLAALEAIKLITGYGSPLFNVLLLFDGASTSIRRVKAQRDPGCPVCSKAFSVVETTV
jgi:molybdopterin/thiamine biosynthesis adenylyltransferase